MYKCIAFDLDGTLVDAFEAVYQSVNHALTEMGYDHVDDHSIMRAVGWGDRDLLTRFVSQEDAAKTLELFRAHHRVALKTGTKFLPGAQAALEALKGHGYQLALATNRPRFSTDVILETLSARDFFHHTICADQVPNAKPEPDLLHHIMAQLGLEAHELLYVGDMTVDIESAKNAGVAVMAVCTGTCTREELEALKPNKVLDGVGQLIEVLK
jgi:2-phosphoglycolate phosphatase